MIGELKKIQFARFRMEMEAIDPLSLPPYKGSTFRGAFGNTFKRLVCVKRDMDCASCLLRNRCVYFYVFETPSVDRAAPNRGYTFAPHPFVIEPPEEEKERYEPGEVLFVNLVLIGQAIDHLPYFIYAFEEMGQRGLGKGRGKIDLKQVVALGTDEEQVVYAGNDGPLNTAYPKSQGPRRLGAANGQARLRFRTPARLKNGGRISGTPQFPLLVRSLFRRVSDLARFHCNAELELDYRGWIEQAEAVRVTDADLRWHDWARYSHRQGQKMFMGGMVGEVLYEGNLKPFAPLLRLGADLHVGKGTGFGLGKYDIIGREDEDAG